jgi:hypothetical protein
MTTKYNKLSQKISKFYVKRPSKIYETVGFGIKIFLHTIWQLWFSSDVLLSSNLGIMQLKVLSESKGLFVTLSWTKEMPEAFTKALWLFF